VVVEAVLYEPVSGGKVPANREITEKIFNFGRIFPKIAYRPPDISATCEKVP
jgi:hypothetical protein